MLRASHYGNLECVHIQAVDGSDLTLTVQNKDGWTPLHSASRNGRLEIVQFLVEHGADLTVQDKDGWTPLLLVSHNGHLEIVHFLVEHGADLTFQYKFERSPFHYRLSIAYSYRGSFIPNRM